MNRRFPLQISLREIPQGGRHRRQPHPPGLPLLSRVDPGQLQEPRVQQT
jgi:hypothetical protein